MAKPNGEVVPAEVDEKPRKPKFTPPTEQVLSEIKGEFDSYTSPERKTKGGGVKAAETFRIATNRQQFLALFNGDEKVAYFYGSLAAANLANRYSENSPEKVAEKNSKRAEKLLDKLSPEILAALVAKMSARSEVSAQ